MARIHKYTPCTKSKKEDPHPSNTGTLAGPGVPIFRAATFTLQAPTPPLRKNQKRNSRSLSKTGRCQCEKLGGSPKIATKSKTNQRSPSTKNQEVTPPHIKQQTGERPHANFPQKRKLASAQRAPSETLIRPKVAHARAKGAFQWRANAVPREQIRTQIRICSLLKSSVRVSSFFLRPYPVEILEDVFLRS